MVTVPEMLAEPELVAVNAGILPVPLAARPMDVLLFAQLKVTPDGVPDKLFAGTDTPLQCNCADSALTVGTGRTTSDADALLTGEVQPLPLTVASKR